MYELDKLAATILITGLVILVFLGVFQGGMAQSVDNQNDTTTTKLEAIQPEASQIGQSAN